MNPEELGRNDTCPELTDTCPWKEDIEPWHVLHRQIQHKKPRSLLNSSPDLSKYNRPLSTPLGLFPLSVSFHSV